MPGCVAYKQRIGISARYGVILFRPGTIGRQWHARKHSAKPAFPGCACDKDSPVCSQGHARAAAHKIVLSLLAHFRDINRWNAQRHPCKLSKPHDAEALNRIAPCIPLRLHEHARRHCSQCIAHFRNAEGGGETTTEGMQSCSDDTKRAHTGK